MVPQVHFFPAYKKSIMYGYKITLIKPLLNFFTTKIGFAVVSLIFIANCVVRRSRLKACALFSFTFQGFISGSITNVYLADKYSFGTVRWVLSQVTIGTKRFGSSSLLDLWSKSPLMRYKRQHHPSLLC